MALRIEELNDDIHPLTEHKSRKDIGVMRRSIFSRQNFEAAFKFQSGHNPDMEVMDSIIGHSVVKAHTAQRQERQRGMKV